MMNQFKPEQLNEFWFSERVTKLWYHSTPEFDAEVEQQFSAMYQAACDGRLDDWQATAQGCLALILLFDQYPLNVFRNDKKSFATASNAIKTAEQCINKGFNQTLTKAQQSFTAIPFMHSENNEHQALSVKLYKNISVDNLKYARHHFEIVEKFGRFPHRNKILGRESSPEEIAYLTSEQAFTG